VLCQKPIRGITCPESLVRYVIRTHESVIVDDVSRPNLFSEDDYLRGRQTKSILCLPLIKQGRLTGLLYLENTLTSHAFTPDRIAVLELLAAQAAISLENTRLYSDLQEREAKVREAQAELAHVTRVTTLGELTASIAHEVNQPLSAVVTNAEACLLWLDRGTPNLDEARRSVEWIIKDGNRAGEVIRRVRALSKKADTQKAPLDINDVVNEVIALVQRELFSHRVSPRMELAPALGVVLADRVQLQQVIINLVMNGIEAMQAVTDRPRELVLRSHQDDAHQVLVSVKDCGVGISSENADRLFDAFFTTKSAGMGMGLSICRSIIEAHGGRVWAEPNLPHGASFHFTLPSHQEHQP
jgi:C4-dicarboxylate-specific signal transduction histidine kinase